MHSTSIVRTFLGEVRTVQGWVFGVSKCISV